MDNKEGGEQSELSQQQPVKDKAWFAARVEEVHERQKQEYRNYKEARIEGQPYDVWAPKYHFDWQVSDNLRGYLDAWFDQWVQPRYEKAIEQKARAGQMIVEPATPDWIIYNDGLVDLGNEIGNWDMEAQEDWRQVKTAYGILAFPRFSLAEQYIVIGNLQDRREHLKEEGKPHDALTLTPRQAQLLKRIADRASVPYMPEQTRFAFGDADAPNEPHRPKRPDR